MAKTQVKDISAFLKPNVVGQETKFVEVSDRFLDSNGDPIKWEIRIVSADEERRIEKACTEERKDRRTGTITQIRDDTEYLSALSAQGVVFPDLLDRELQKSWDAKGAIELLRKLLTPGELLRLSKAVLKVSGLGDEDLEREIELEGEPVDSVTLDAEYAKN